MASHLTVISLIFLSAVTVCLSETTGTVYRCWGEDASAKIVEDIMFDCWWTPKTVNSNHDLFTRGEKLTIMGADGLGDIFREIPKKPITSIQFQFCKADKLEDKLNENLAEAYPNLKSFNVSHIGLRTFNFDNFWNAKNLEEIHANDNKLTEFPELSDSWPEMTKLIHVDLSNNEISKINSTGLQLMGNLNHLDLSTNKIAELKSEAFAQLPKLKYLNLSNNALSELVMGTFSFQNNLKVLDLSGNDLLKINFDIFLPMMPLKKLLLKQNQLSDLDGFSNTLFPVLNQFDIRENEFNCTYLMNFLRSGINWKNIELVNSRTSDVALNISKYEYVHGIRCEDKIEDAEPTPVIDTTEITPEEGLDSQLISQLIMGLQCLLLLFVLVAVLFVGRKIRRSQEVPNIST